MKGSAPTLLPLLRSRVQGDLLTLLYLHPESKYSLTDMARQIRASVPGVHHEVDRLVAAGYLYDERVGNVRHVRAATDTPVYRPLSELLAVTLGPKPVLTDLLADAAGVDEAYIFGSWAARYAGAAGMGMPNDIDVLVIGKADLDELDQIARIAQTKLQRPVNVTRLSRSAWDAPDPEPFVQTLRSSELIALADTHETTR